MHSRVRSSHATLAVALVALALCACQSDGPSDEERAKQIEIYTDTALGYISMGEYQRAQRQAMEGLALDEENPDLLLALARALQKQSSSTKIRQAENVYRKMDRTKDFRVSLGLAEVLERKGLAYAEAAEGVRDGERYTEADNLELRAEELEEISLACWREAIETYQEGRELSPMNTELLSGLARTHTLLHEFEESQHYCRLTLERTTTDRAFYQEQLLRSGITLREEDRFRQALARMEDLEMVVRMLLSTLLEQDDPEGAAAQLGYVIEMRPELAEAYSRRAELLARLGRNEEVIADIDRFLKRSQLPFDHPDIQRAFRIKSTAEQQL